MKFPYQKFPPPSDGPLANRKYFPRPVIQIGLIDGGGQTFSYNCLVDSGADLALFHSEIGKAMGIDVLSGPQGTCNGVGSGSAICYYHKVRVKVGGWEHEIDVGFVENFKPSFGLLGRHPLFDIYKVHFDDRKEELELRERHS